jgi:hypothetical protein
MKEQEEAWILPAGQADVIPIDKTMPTCRSLQAA